MITIGDSFWWNIIYHMPVQDIFSVLPYWYYNSTIYYDPFHHSVNEVNLVDEILSADFINLFYSSTQLYKLNNGFTKNALIALCYDPEEIDSIQASLEQNIYYDSTWISGLREKAESEGKNVEEVVHDAAKWFIYNSPEQFFPALNDSIPTKRSKRVNDFLSMDSLSFVEQEIERTILNIKSNEPQMETIREKAKQQGKTFEQAIRDDAKWIVNQKMMEGTLRFPGKKLEVNPKAENNGIQ